MKISVQQSILSHHLEKAAKFLPKKESIPILSHIVLTATKTGLEIVAGNGDTYLKSVIPAGEYILEQEGAVALPSKVSDIALKMSGLITIQSEAEQVFIRAGKSEFALSFLDSEEYPKFPTIYGSRISLKGKDLRELIAITAYAVSTDESSPILNGILFSQQNNILKLISCDRHRLAQIEVENEGEEFQAVVRASILVELSKIINDGEVDISFNDAMLIRSTDFTFYTRILNGSYPEIGGQIPNRFETEITLSRQELAGALGRIMIVAKEEKVNLVKITIDSKEILLESTGQSKRAQEYVDIKGFKGDPITIGANGRFLQEALKAIEATDVDISLSGKLTPIIIRGKEELSFHMVLPYRV